MTSAVGLKKIVRNRLVDICRADIVTKLQSVRKQMLGKIHTYKKNLRIRNADFWQFAKVSKRVPGCYS